MPDPARLNSLIEAELQGLNDPQMTAAIRAGLIDPVHVMLDWDYGAPDQQFPGWLVFDDPMSGAEIVFCAEGFGPSRPWGLTGLVGERRAMGMDSGWYQSFIEAWLNSWAASDLERGAPLGHGPADA